MCVGVIMLVCVVGGVHLGLAVDLGGAGLIGHADPEIAVGIELEIERALRLFRPQQRQRMIRDLAGLGIELADDLAAEVGIPGVPVGIDHDVVRHCLLARQVEFGDHDLGGAALRTRQGLVIVFLAIGVAEIDADQEIGRRLHHVGGDARALAARPARDQQLRMRRRRFRRITAHAGEHLLPFVGVVQRGEHALQGVAAHAIRQERFDLVVAGDADQPFRIRELIDEVFGLGELDVGACLRSGRDLDRLRTHEIVARRADADGVAAGLELAGGEAVLALVVAHHRGGDGRSLLLGAHQHAFHQAFLGGRDLSAQRGLRRGPDRERNGQHAGKADGAEKRTESHGRLPR
jgi:hypothetical protein